MKPFLKYGLLTGLASGLWGISCFTVVGWLNVVAFHGRIPAARIRSYSGLFSIVLLVLGIWWGMREARRRNGGLLTYGQAVGTGVLIACITGLIAASFSYVYCTAINPGYAAFMVQDAEKSLQAAGKSPREIAAALESVRREFTTGVQVAQALAAQIGVGTIAALILGIFTRTKK